MLVGQSERPSCYLLGQLNTYALSVVHSDISDLAIGMQFFAQSNFAEVDSRVTSVSGCVCVSASVFVCRSGVRSYPGRMCVYKFGSAMYKANIFGAGVCNILPPILVA